MTVLHESFRELVVNFVEYMVADLQVVYDVYRTTQLWLRVCDICSNSTALGGCVIFTCPNDITLKAQQFGLNYFDSLRMIIDNLTTYREEI